MTKKLNADLTAAEAFKQASERVICTFVDGNPKTACRNGGWHISLAEPREYGISVTPLEFVEASLGQREANKKLNEHRRNYAQQLRAGA